MKRIAITQRVIPTEVGANRDGLEQDYVEYYQKFGVQLIPIPNVLQDVEEYLSGLSIDGIILSGGNDINPAFYGEQASELWYADERDKTEQAVLVYAVAQKIPVLCECRGTQFLNVYFGGKLRKITSHVAKNHEINLSSTNRFPLKGCKEVNSYHNKGFSEEDLAQELKIFAKSKDGFIEGIYHPDLPIAGLLWHPERPSPDSSFNEELVNAFLQRKWFWQ